LLYKLFYFPARLALYFYCRSISVNKKSLLKIKGPVLLAANHPNTFLDAVIFASLFHQPIYSLAKGDAFISPFVNKILQSFNIFPVYRISEGAENLKNNYDTFARVQQLLLRGKIVLIFSEGKCVSEWHLRPLKKGTARIAFEAWESGIDVKILPAGINYSSFRHFGKNVFIEFGNIIEKEKLAGHHEGKKLNTFNDILKKELSDLVLEIPVDDRNERKKVFELKSSRLKRILIAVPAGIGYLINSPFYYSAHFLIRKRAHGYYDGVMVGIMFLFYPLYVFLITLLVRIATHNPFSWLLLLIIPLTALSVLHARNVVEK